MSSHRCCYSFGATSPLFAAHPPPFWPSFCVCFLANPCSSCLALCSVLYAACSSLCSASPSPSRFKAPPFPCSVVVIFMARMKYWLAIECFDILGSLVSMLRVIKSKHLL
ncbi:hypothetical protein AAHE18_15G139300 [Arachis hypogaea]